MKQNLKDNCFEQLYSNLKQIVDLGEVSLTGQGKMQLEILLKASEAHLKVSYSQSSRIADLEEALKSVVGVLIDPHNDHFYRGFRPLIDKDDQQIIEKAKQLLNK
jgi:translation elongation factor EF-G